MWDSGRLKSFNLLRHFYEEVKFKDTTWYGFFERHIVPLIVDRIHLNSPVAQITNDGVRLSTGRTVAG